MAGYNNEEDDRTLLDLALDYTPESALIYGLTRAQQDGIIKNFADRTIKRKNEYEQGRYFNDLMDQRDYNYSRMNSARDRDFLVDVIHNMPEDLQDSFLLSIIDSGDPRFNYDAKTSNYNPSGNVVTLKKYDPFTLVHEYLHSINQNMNNYNKKYYRQNIPVPDRMAEINLGKLMDREFMQSIREKARKAISSNNRSEIEGILKNFIGYTGSQNLQSNAKMALSDMLTMNPYGNVPDNLIDGHDSKYKKEQVSSNKVILPKSSGTAPYYAPMGIEGSADLGEVLASQYGESWMKSRMPETYEAMMNEFRNDPRKEMVKDGRFIIPWLWTNNENTEEYKFIPESKKDMYFRVQSPYGGYRDGYTPYRANSIAETLGKDYFEFKDLDGKWQKETTEKKRKGFTPNFDNSYEYYIQTPNGRKGFGNMAHALDYMVANPDLQELYENAIQENPDGTLIFHNGEPVRKWERSDAIKRHLPKWSGLDRKKEIEKFVKERALMDKVRKEKIKEAEKALAKKALQYIRMVK